MYILPSKPMTKFWFTWGSMDEATKNIYTFGQTTTVTARSQSLPYTKICLRKARLHHRLLSTPSRRR